MKKKKNFVCLSLVFLFSMIGFAVCAAPNDGTEFTWTLTEQEQKFVELLNAEREKRGLQPLTVCNGLTDGAQQWSVKMRSGRWGHGASYECIARGAPTAEAAFRMWMRSPPHRGLLLSRGFTVMGVGQSGNYWTFWGGTDKTVIRSRTVVRDRGVTVPMFYAAPYGSSCGGSCSCPCQK